MEEKFVKFTQGEGEDLTPNKPYGVVAITQDLLFACIIDDIGCGISICLPKSAHIGGNRWHFCDENGNLV